MAKCYTLGHCFESQNSSKGEQKLKRKIYQGRYNHKGISQQHGKSNGKSVEGLWRETQIENKSKRRNIIFTFILFI